ncbi:MAG: hypothetical protein E7355_02235 [Clostridiales bacterium]|nr:hypothetical protein [Clostridiales bacterium]
MQKNQLPKDLDDEYSALLEFAQEKNRLSYADFDALTLTTVNLFVTPKDGHFREIERTLNKIIRALPSLKRIFSKPITRLTEVYNVLPIESVRVVNNQSMCHVSRHSELWGDIKDGELKPKKLMTLDKCEEYLIYENIAFARLINIILSYVKRNISLLKDIMYAHRDLHVNLLQRTNHLNYFLAIGKLNLGYSRAQDEYQMAYGRCLEKLLFIDNTLRAKLHSSVYRHCKKDKSKLTLKKTNVFRLHKDYIQVYSLLRWFIATNAEIEDELYVGDASREGYTAYCNMLAVFSAGHFNFQFTTRKRLNFLNLSTEATFKDWKLELEEYRCEGIRGLLFSFHKDKDYRICLIFRNDGEQDERKVEKFKAKCSADEYFYADPWESGVKGFFYLSIFDIDSFRRMQQLIFRGMVYSDEKRDVCPFCGKTLTPTKEGHVCVPCRTVIKQTVCPEKQEAYFETGIYEYTPKVAPEEANKRNKFLTDKFIESQLFFRNITDINFFGKTICPKCGKVHE